MLLFVTNRSERISFNIATQSLYTVQILLYFIKTRILLKNYIRVFKEKNSDNVLIQLNWLKSLTTALVIFTIIDSTVFFPLYIFRITFPSAGYASGFVLTVFTSLVAFLIVANPRKLFPMGESENTKSFKAHLPEESVKQCAENLILIMKEKSPFKKRDLTLYELSQIVGVSPKILSQTINQEFNESYYDFINKFRVKEAQRLILDDNFKNYTIESVANEAGFNSRASFYRIFKHHTGKTPTQIIKSE